MQSLPFSISPLGKEGEGIWVVYFATPHDRQSQCCCFLGKRTEHWRCLIRHGRSSGSFCHVEFCKVGRETPEVVYFHLLVVCSSIGRKKKVFSFFSFTVLMRKCLIYPIRRTHLLLPSYAVRVRTSRNIRFLHCPSDQTAPSLSYLGRWGSAREMNEEESGIVALGAEEKIVREPGERGS
ncbi:uncharacterized protein LY79DRAFT_155597 [Colletotrichum navitas]|uniref:Uncharacterized protein n=1 Tax=Colletotrichum navitas TaxID=681940 RepID=A0AAD8Q3Z2_9PEZI|nr:uncharacterized protein LY79DRAFT_155597 [Colletotrichum navitas]KAK1594404.1 hypothetical protein LY79DRAFT_155597 [Colletotrichum navitas]